MAEAWRFNPEDPRRPDGSPMHPEEIVEYMREHGSRVAMEQRLAPEPIAPAIWQERESLPERERMARAITFAVEHHVLKDAGVENAEGQREVLLVVCPSWPLGKELGQTQAEVTAQLTRFAGHVLPLHNAQSQLFALGFRRSQRPQPYAGKVREAGNLPLSDPRCQAYLFEHPDFLMHLIQDAHRRNFPNAYTFASYSNNPNIRGFLSDEAHSALAEYTTSWQPPLKQLMEKYRPVLSQGRPGTFQFSVQTGWCDVDDTRSQPTKHLPMQPVMEIGGQHIWTQEIIQNADAYFQIIQRYDELREMQRRELVEALLQTDSSVVPMAHIHDTEEGFVLQMLAKRGARVRIVHPCVTEHQKRIKSQLSSDPKRADNTIFYLLREKAAALKPHQVKSPLDLFRYESLDEPILPSQPTGGTVDRTGQGNEHPPATFQRLGIVEKLLHQLQYEAVFSVSPGRNGYQIVTIPKAGEPGKGMQLFVSNERGSGAYALYDHYDPRSYHRVGRKSLRVDRRAITIDWEDPQQWERAMQLILSTPKRAYPVGVEDEPGAPLSPFEHRNDGHVALRPAWKDSLKEDLWTIAQYANARRKSDEPTVEPWDLQKKHIIGIPSGAAFFRFGGSLAGRTWIDRWTASWLASESYHKNMHKLYPQRDMMLEDLKHFAFDS